MRALGAPAAAADVVLRDGSTVHLRPVLPDDEALLQEFFDGLDPESQAFRFFSGAVDTARAAHSLAAAAEGSGFGLIALRGADRRPIGHGLYLGLDESTAEIAFAVADDLQGYGLGTILLAHLAEAAAREGYTRFFAEVLPRNLRMIEMFRESGFPVRIEASAEGLRVEFPTSLAPEAVERFEDRDRIAARAAVARIFEPTSIAVVGASRRPGAVGAEVLRNLLASPFAGPIYAVNPAADSVQSQPAYPSVSAIPREVDLAVLAVAADAVPEAARECAAKGARGLVVLSAGFAEDGPAGRERERELLEICRESGMRLVGPNCLGVLDTNPDSGLDATFAPQVPPPGNVGFATQSGALGLALIEFARERGLGVSTFASLGNRADLTANDMLEYWEEDERTALALLYIESFSDPRRFARVARRVGRRKPVVAMKSGTSSAGARAASSHTGALLAGSDRATEALFEQSGVIRAETLSEMLDVAALLSSQPPPPGRRVAIVTNAGGPGIICADACEAAGLKVPELPGSLRDELASFLPEEASFGNPVDLIATASADQFRKAIAALGEWDEADALIAIFIRPLAGESDEVMAAMREAVEGLEREIPAQLVFMSTAEPPAQPGPPVHRFPEDAARALGKVSRHARWRELPEAPPLELDGLRPEEAAAILSEALAAGREWLGAQDCLRLLECYGIASPEAIVATDPEAAGRAADRLGGRLALKAHGPGILHKTELGAIRTDLAGGEQVREAAREISRALARQGLAAEGFLVQRMAGEGPELLVGVAEDPVFGPVLACGAGGTAVELLGDLSLRVCPLREGDGESMLRSLAIFPMLTGFRGRPASDLASLSDLVERVGALADNHREVVELDLNPVIATPDGALAVDARVRVAPAGEPRSWPRTWS